MINDNKKSLSKKYFIPLEILFYQIKSDKI